MEEGAAGMMEMAVMVIGRGGAKGGASGDWGECRRNGSETAAGEEMMRGAPYKSKRDR